MKTRFVGAAIVCALAACQTLGGFEEYQRGDDPREEAGTGGEPGAEGGGTSGANASRAGSGGSPSSAGNGASGGNTPGGAPAEDGGEGGTSGSGGSEAGGTLSVGGTSGGSSSGATGNTAGDGPDAGTGGIPSGGSAGTGAVGGTGGTGGIVEDCSTEIEEHPVTSVDVVDTCAPVTYATNPPCEGAHYLDSAAYQIYSEPIPKGFLVHSLLHGGIVIWYNCPAGCPAEVARVEAWAEALPEDTTCPPEGPRRRLILVPDPELTVRWAASAWGWTLRAPCFDPIEFLEFYEAHYRRSPEDWCPGLDVAPNICSGSSS